MISFYSTHEVLVMLAEDQYEEDRLSREMKFTYHFIDNVFKMIFQKEKDHCKLDFYIRNDLGAGEDPVATITEEGEGTPETTYPESMYQVVDMKDFFTKTYTNIKKLSESSFFCNLLDKYQDIDEELEGVLFSKKDNEIHAEKVEGKKRPDLTCLEFLTYNVVKGRPYLDELTDSLWEDTESFDDILEQAEAGEEDSIRTVAMAYLQGDQEKEIETDLEKAAYWLHKLAEFEDSEAEYNLSLLYFSGAGVDQDFKKAIYWMDRARVHGDADAEDQISVFNEVMNLQEKVEKNDVDSIITMARLLTMMAEGIDNEFSCYLHKSAVNYELLAIKNGYIDAYGFVGLAYLKGRGVEKNKKKAIEYFEKGIELGSAKCLCEMGTYYIESDDEEIQKKGFQLMLQAAEAGSIVAMYNVGTAYQYERGVEFDMEQACKWYEKYLEYEDNPELEFKVKLFKGMF